MSAKPTCRILSSYLKDKPCIADDSRNVRYGIKAASPEKIASGDGKRLVVRADEKLTRFIELEWTIRASDKNLYENVV